MQNQNGSTGHNGHMSQADIDELHLILESYAAGLISLLFWFSVNDFFELGG